MAMAGVRGVRPWRRLLCGITKLYRLTTSQTFPRWRAWLQDRHRVRRRRGATSPRSVPYQRSMKAVWIVGPSCRRRNCLTKRRGPPKTTRLLTSTTWPAGLRTLTTWTSYHLSRTRERFLPFHKDFLPTAGVIERVLAQHGHEHA